MRWLIDGMIRLDPIRSGTVFEFFDYFDYESIVFPCHPQSYVPCCVGPSQPTYALNLSLDHAALRQITLGALSLGLWGLVKELRPRDGTSFSHGRLCLGIEGYDQLVGLMVRTSGTTGHG